MLAELLGAEVAARRERYLTTCTRLAHLPFQRTLEQFDFAFQPSIDERLVKELANLALVPEATNILLLGPPGVGKTHLAVGLALRAIENGFGAYFVRACELMGDLRKARAEYNLDRRMKVYLAPKLCFTHFKRRRRGNPQAGGTGRLGVPAYRGWLRTVKNLLTPATGGAAPGRWRPRRWATACRTRPPGVGSWGAVFATRGRPRSGLAF